MEEIVSAIRPAYAGPVTPDLLTLSIDDRDRMSEGVSDIKFAAIFAEREVSQRRLKDLGWRPKVAVDLMSEGAPPPAQTAPPAVTPEQPAPRRPAADMPPLPRPPAIPPAPARTRPWPERVLPWLPSLWAPVERPEPAG